MMLKGTPFKRRTKLLHKQLVRAVNPSAVVPGEIVKKAVMDASTKASNVQAHALAMETVLQIQTMINE
jgi:hypothetical protein